MFNHLCLDLGVTCFTPFHRALLIRFRAKNLMQTFVELVSLKLKKKKITTLQPEDRNLAGRMHMIFRFIILNLNKKT